jgi:hypothetical protein
MEQNPVLDEATAVAMSIAIGNHIAALQAWQRKLQQPYLPTSNKVYTLYRITPLYPKPTLVTAMHILESCQHVRMELGRLMTAFVKAKNLEEA